MILLSIRHYIWYRKIEQLIVYILIDIYNSIPNPISSFPLSNTVLYIYKGRYLPISPYLQHIPEYPSALPTDNHSAPWRLWTSLKSYDIIWWLYFPKMRRHQPGFWIYASYPHKKSTDRKVLPHSSYFRPCRTMHVQTCSCHMVLSLSLQELFLWQQAQTEVFPVERVSSSRTDPTASSSSPTYAMLPIAFFAPDCNM